MKRKFVILLLALLVSQTALAVKIADITRLGGQRTNVLTGLGLVYGLKGTGDGGDFLPAIKPLASMLGKFADPATVLELQKVQNVALVSITATIPGDGVRDGEETREHLQELIARLEPLFVVHLERGVNLRVREVAHITRNGDDVVVDHDDWTIECV